MDYRKQEHKCSRLSYSSYICVLCSFDLRSVRDSRLKRLTKTVSIEVIKFINQSISDHLEPCHVTDSFPLPSIGSNEFSLFLLALAALGILPAMGITVLIMSSV
jgi:hypothetical protein